MTTDKTPATLATAKHGGCVQLGDGLPSPLEELRDAAQHVIHCADGGGDYNCGRPMIEAMTTLGLMKKTGRGMWSVNVRAAQAVVDALAAQPSPGGQGDALLRKAIADGVAESRTVAHVAAMGNQTGDAQRCLDAAQRRLEAALAARQPVGEPVGYFDPDVLAHLTEGLIDPVGVLRRKPNGKSNVPVWLAPPAQAVDLDSARHEGHDCAIRYVLGYLNGTGDLASTQYGEILNGCGRESIIRSAIRDGELEFTGLGRWVAKYGTDAERALISSLAVQS